jgi:hypothetical protein
LVIAVGIPVRIVIPAIAIAVVGSGICIRLVSIRVIAKVPIHIQVVVTITAAIVTCRVKCPWATCSYRYFGIIVDTASVNRAVITASEISRIEQRVACVRIIKIIPVIITIPWTE